MKIKQLIEKYNDQTLLLTLISLFLFVFIAPAWTVQTVVVVISGVILMLFIQQKYGDLIKGLVYSKEVTNEPDPSSSDGDQPKT